MSEQLLPKKLTSKISFNPKSEIRERKRQILHLIKEYLAENRLVASAEALEKEAQLSDEWKVCENVDLDIILQEYQSYYFIKYQKYPKILKKIEEGEDKLKINRKTSSKCRKQNPEPIVKNDNNEDFQFEIITLPLSDQKTSAIPKTLCDFEHYTPEWRELADIILREFTLKNNTTVDWSDCIGLNHAIEKLQEAVIYPKLYPNMFKNFLSWKGILLFGPPGTGKTLLAKAVASEGSTKFVSLTAGTFVSKWRGESEKMIAVLFDLARHFQPSTIFIDEIDALVPNSDLLHHDASRRFKTQLLTEMDGLNPESDIFVLATTNNPWNLDPALLRRFEKRIFVPVPDEESKIEILKHYLRKFGNSNLKNEDLRKIVTKMINFTGSDIKILCKTIQMKLIREKIKSGKCTGELRKVSIKDVEEALGMVKQCSNKELNKRYENWNEEYGSI